MVVTALHVVDTLAEMLATTLEPPMVAGVGLELKKAGGGVVAMAVVRDLFGGKRLVVMLSRLALVSGVVAALRTAYQPFAD